MHLAKGWWVPDYDTGDIEANITTEPSFAGRASYQLDAFLACLSLGKNFRYALDVGAHIGLWTAPLSRCFDHVWAYEPVPAHVECLYRNTAGDWPCGRSTIWAHALGDESGVVDMATRPPISLKARVKTSETDYVQPVKMMRMDEEGPLPYPIDFIKIDCEGYELHVIKGGEQTIRKHKPLMLVEQKPNNTKRYGLGLDAVDLLKSWGAEVRWEKSGDYCLGWP